MRLLLGFLLFLPVFAQQTFYPFPIDQDGLTGAPDFSFLNNPLEAKDRIFVRDGQFFRVGADLEPQTNDDERVRFFGVNLAFGANFPTAEDAPRIARRLRRMGVNLVRFHHMDSQPDSNPANANSILTTGPYPTFNSVSMGRLRTFLDALKAEGIYANINLKVGYVFRPAVDQVPALPAGVAFPSQSKPLHMIEPRMVALQAEYAQRLLGELALRDDPVLALVELNNETSLLYSWQTGEFDQTVVGEYAAEAQRQWNTYLRGAKTSTEELRAEWGASTPEGPEVLPGRWAALEVHSPARARLETTEDGVKVTLDQAGNWVILKQINFTLEAGTSYVAEVEIRAGLANGATGQVAWRVGQDRDPWGTAGSRTLTVTNQWQKVRWGFTATVGAAASGRFGLWLENAGGPVYVRGASLRQAGLRGLDDGESLESGNIAMPNGLQPGTEARTDDFIRFLAERDRVYSQSLLAGVRASVDSLAPVTGTQQEFSGLMSIDSQAGLDYFDKHWYVDHYAFPNVAWDGRDWRFRDISNLATGLEVFLQAATARPHGFPYTVSEFNQPWPNTYAAEMNPTFSVFAAFQDWDALMHFAYAHGRGWDDGVPSGFNLNGDWTKYPNVGQSAWLFRSGAIEAGREPIDLPAPLGQRIRYTRERRTGGFNAFFTATGQYDPRNAVIHPVRLRPDLDGPLPEAAQAPVTFPATSDTGQMTYDLPGKLFLVHAPLAAGVFGFVGKARVTAGALDVELAEGARGTANILLTALDGYPIGESRRMLLSNPGYTLRTLPGSNPPEPQPIVPYGAGYYTLKPDVPNKPSGNLNGGVGPAWMERVEAIVQVRTAAPGMVVYPLRPNGERMEPLDLEKTDEGYRVRLSADTPWYEWVAEEQPAVQGFAKQ